MDYKAKQPSILINSIVDATAADTVESCLHENTLRVSRQIKQAPNASPTATFFMCNPKTDHGPDRWHRDVRGRRQAPLRGLQEDMLANTPFSIQ